jgi:hypothetical protein
MPIKPPVPPVSSIPCLDGSALVVCTPLGLHHVELRGAHGLPAGELYQGHPLRGERLPDADFKLRGAILAELGAHAGAFPGSDTGRFTYPRLQQLWAQLPRP